MADAPTQPSRRRKSKPTSPGEAPREEVRTRSFSRRKSLENSHDNHMDQIDANPSNSATSTLLKPTKATQMHTDASANSSAYDSDNIVASIKKFTSNASGRGSPRLQQSERTDRPTNDDSDDESHDSSEYDADDMELLPNPRGSSSRKRSISPSLDETLEASRTARKNVADASRIVELALQKADSLHITEARFPALLDIVKEIPRQFRPEYIRRLNDSKFVRTVLESKYVVSRIPCQNELCTTSNQMGWSGVDRWSAEQVAHRNLRCRKEGFYKGCGRQYGKRAPDLIRIHRTALIEAFADHEDLHYSPFANRKRRTTREIQAAKRSATIAAHRTVDLTELDDSIFETSSVFHPRNKELHPSQKYASIPEKSNFHLSTQERAAPIQFPSLSLNTIPPFPPPPLPTLPYKSKRHTILEDGYNSPPQVPRPPTAMTYPTENRIEENNNAAATRHDQLRRDFERQAQEMAIFKQTQSSQMSELKAMMTQLVDAQTRGFASMTERIKAVETPLAPRHFPQLAPSRPTPLAVDNSPSLQAIALPRDPHPVTISQEIENADGESEWLKVATAMHPPTPASFGVYQQDIVNLNHELEALSSDWSKNAQTRFPPREIAVIYVKQIQRSDERLLAQNMATAIRSITNERPILFVSFIGDSLAEFIVTKRHRDLLIAVIRTRRGILLGDIDPVFGQLRRDGLPPIISSKQYQNAIQCLKRAKKCLRYKGAEVTAHFTELVRRSEQVIEKYKAANPDTTSLRSTAPRPAASPSAPATSTALPVQQNNAATQNNQQQKQAASAAARTPPAQHSSMNDTANAKEITQQNKQTATAVARQQLSENLPGDSDDDMMDIAADKPNNVGNGNSTSPSLKL